MVVAGNCEAATGGGNPTTKVVRAALENAASVAGLLLTTSCLIADKPKAESADAGGGGGMGNTMGGMGGMGGMDF